MKIHENEESESQVRNFRKIMNHFQKHVSNCQFQLHCCPNQRAAGHNVSTWLALRQARTSVRARNPKVQHATAARATHTEYMLPPAQ
jgi:hypothetical protein